MKHLGMGILLSLFVLNAAQAQEGFPGLGGSTQAGATDGDKKDYPGFSLRLKGGPSLLSHSLESTGTTKADVPAKQGLFYQLNAKWEGEWWSADVDYKVQETRLVDLAANVSPREAYDRIEGYFVNFRFRPLLSKDGFKNFYFGLGAGGKKREVNDLNPKIFSHWTTSGFNLLMGNTWQVFQTAFLETELKSYTPFFFTEKYRTGYLASFYDFEASAQLIYPYTDLLEFGVGVYFEYIQMTFSGSSDRSAPNGKETIMNYGIPLEIRLRF